MRSSRLRLPSATILLLLALGCASLDLRGRRTTCSLHQVPLEEETVKIVHGLPMVGSPYLVSEGEQFPFAKEFVWGGCVVTPESPRWGRVRYCPECRQVRARYLQSWKRS